VNKKQQ